MKILSVEVLTEPQCVLWKRSARYERRKARVRLGRTNPLDLLQLDISGNRSRRDPTPEPMLPAVLSETILRNDDPGIALLSYARHIGSPVFVGLSSQPSRRFESDLRSAAKGQGLMLHFYRLIDRFIIVKVDQRFPEKKK
jgi:hypothetical protein